PAPCLTLFPYTTLFRSLAGLNALWDSLAEFLQVEHQVELVLPKETPHPQIGRTLRIAFPTWRDRSILRKLRIRLDRDAHLSQSRSEEHTSELQSRENLV